MYHKKLSIFLILVLGIFVINTPVFGQVEGPVNPNANVTTAYKLLHQNGTVINMSALSSSSISIITVNNPGIQGNYVIANLTNNQDREQKFTYLVQCQDHTGITIGLEGLSSSMLAGGKFTASVGCGNHDNIPFTVQIFILESLANPMVLAQPLLITSETGVGSYSQNYNSSSITLSGTVNVPVVQNKVILLILDPNANLVQIVQPDVESDGRFSTNIKTGGPLFKQSGTYTVKVYNDGIPQNNLAFNYNMMTGQAIIESISPMPISTQPPISQPLSPNYTNPYVRCTNCTNTSNNQSLPQLTQSTSTPITTSTKIPNWVKGVFSFYAQGNLSDDDLIKALQFLIQQGIIKIS